MGVAIAAAAIGAAGTIGGALLSKQKAPGIAPPVNIGAVTQQATAANANNLAANESLAASTNSFDQDQATALLNQALPGYSAASAALMSASSQYQQNAESGTLSPAQTAQISQFAAEQGVTRGTSGNFNGFNVVSDFGENLQAYQQSQQNMALGTLSAAYGMAPKINPMSPSSMFVTPGQALGVAQANTSAQQAGLNASAAASNANASLLGNAFSSSAGLFSAYATKQQPSPAGSSMGNMEQGVAAAQTAFNTPANFNVDTSAFGPP